MYSFEPRVTGAPDFSDFHRQFIEDSLVDITVSLESIWVPLLILERNISDAMKYIIEHYDVEQICSHEETGNAITYDRDIMMGKYLKSRDILWTEYPTKSAICEEINQIYPHYIQISIYEKKNPLQEVYNIVYFVCLYSIQITEYSENIFELILIKLPHLIRKCTQT